MKLALKFVFLLAFAAVASCEDFFDKEAKSMTVNAQVTRCYYEECTGYSGSEDIVRAAATTVLLPKVTAQAIACCMKANVYSAVYVHKQKRNVGPFVYYVFKACAIADCDYPGKN